MTSVYLDAPCGTTSGGGFSTAVSCADPRADGLQAILNALRNIAL